MSIARILGAGLAALVLSWLAPAHADTVVGVHTWSVHEPRSPDASNDNPGLYVRANGWQAGLYRNSVRRPSAYVVRTWDLGPVELAAGVVTGYQRVRQPAPCASVARWLGVSVQAAEALERDEGWACWRDVGSTRHRLAPLATLSAALPAIGDITPRITIAPRLGGSSAVIHLSLEAPL